ncbi:IcmF1 [Pseudomonas aeruginosa]|nr:IcmF1 [Pseudomonas aeruginosa]
MKGFLNFFARWVVPVLGLLALSLIIWFLGPLLRLGNYEPLASATSRWVLIVLLFLVWIGFRVLRIVQARRNAAKVMQSLAEVSAPDAASVATAEELATLKQRMDEALALLKRAKLGRQRAAQPVRVALVRDHRPARFGQDHRADELRPGLPARRTDGRRGDPRGRRHAQLRLVVHRRSGAAGHRRPLYHPGQPRPGGQGRLAGLPRPAQDPAQAPPHRWRVSSPSAFPTCCWAATPSAPPMPRRSAHASRSCTSSSGCASRST